MVYLDYSATTPVNKEVLDTFVKVSTDYIANANSLHSLGIKSKRLMEASVKQVSEILNVNEKDLIFTSGATESNNLAILGIASRFSNRNKHIITTKLEHSSVLEVVNYLEKNDYKISYVNILDNGLIDLDHLKELLSDDPLLVSISYVNSEIGVKQNIDEISNMIKLNSKAFFHVDATQAVGKIKVDFKNFDLVSFSAHKFYGIQGVGCLIKKSNIVIDPIIYGGKSQSVYRGGTPNLSLIVSLAKAIRLAYKDFSDKYSHVLELNKYLNLELSKIEDITINSNQFSIPYIVNISTLVKSETLLHSLEEKEIYISTKTACSKDSSASLALLAMNKDIEVASKSIRISLSYLTTKEEIDTFLIEFKDMYNKLKSL